ncbi:hypothetical protein [Haloarcula sp. 1CSR25-25]|jgi:hypothetical protein|uniref:hypothetical protein n=1 Tax=Haloarcula sp. 1CSR25-25 TaxID=2862545 RepID=UPI0028947A2D|nr:hypothetical protein [Haloarcula sp. 1CSR25-25]MDT3435746.1 hypothetical protein [Haloarcula sp. 1CSR25-25]
MFEADPLTMVQFANDAAQTVMQAGPPTDLPGQVPDFVGDILAEVSSMAGGESSVLGESISGMTPDGSEAGAAENASSAVNGAADNAPGK